jgi:uncharacterized surface protein with fasciclin (FAS1) repeats
MQWPVLVLFFFRDAVASPALQTVVGLIHGDPDLSVMYTWLGAAGLLHGALDHPLSGPFTVLAPTDKAFATLSNATKAHWLDPANADALGVLVENWMVPAKACATCRPKSWPIAALTDGLVLPTVAGNRQLVVSAGTGATSVNASAITSPDHGCSNGIVHRMGGVIGLK